MKTLDELCCLTETKRASITNFRVEQRYTFNGKSIQQIVTAMNDVTTFKTLFLLHLRFSISKIEQESRENDRTSVKFPGL